MILNQSFLALKSFKAAVIKTLVLIVCLSCAFSVQASVKRLPTVKMVVGQVRVMDIKNITRVAVGSGKIVNYRSLENGQLLLIASEIGNTDVHIWQKGDRESVVRVAVSGSNTQNDLANAQKLSKQVPGLSVVRQGDNIAFFGNVAPSDETRIKSLIQIFPNAVDLTRLDGFIDKPMVRMDVRILEVSIDDVKKLGIRWNTTASGPAIGLHKSFVNNGTFRNYSENNDGIAEGISGAITGFDYKFYKYFGITTGLGSTLDLMAEAGKARSIASPKLMARSGEKAHFASGGEFPYQIRTDNGFAVEFKEYGVILDIKPQVSGDRIRTMVKAEVSSIDFSVVTQGTPGLIKDVAETDINLTSGDTLVISGLSYGTTSSRADKVPFLGDLPWIGALFRSKNERSRTKDLLITVTPHLVNSSSDKNKQLLNEANKWIEDFDGKFSLNQALME
ncbi:type II and III secretion system protein family protein [Pelagibaculum spongiae]|uniref:Uncharacterized protein n=1 Tax=Pelagibaculum spongiae TaxID=2080658 RepID=A0A2V1GW73_9GAMM|nr:pilus assembly protein N-terminal domain-containing protein [Pelagibaculum spongiae]PVZ68198.1 hypothetical protein DC094_12935 [Pelagibaculum spongiae]